jgi:Domain of unknown function (DUF4402)
MIWGNRFISTGLGRLAEQAPPQAFWRLLVVAVACLLVSAPATAIAKERANAVGQSVATIVTRLSFIKTQDLDFGQIVPSNSAGTVTIAPGGTRSSTGGVMLVGDPGQPARFAGYGFRNQTVLISLSSLTGTLQRKGGTETMRFDTFIIGSTPQVQLSTAPLSFRIASTTGQFAFPVGATLRVAARQRPGTYLGTFTILLQYQ